MFSLSKQECEIIKSIFNTAKENDLLIIKRAINEVKNCNGLYQLVIKAGSDLNKSKLCIIEKTGLGDKLSGQLSMILWFLVKPKIERQKRLKFGITEAIWVYEDFLCKHPGHFFLNGKKYQIKKGIKTGLFKRIHPGQLVGCGCMSRVATPF